MSKKNKVVGSTEGIVLCNITYENVKNGKKTSSEFYKSDMFPTLQSVLEDMLIGKIEADFVYSKIKD